MNINQHFSNLVTKAAEQDADTSQLITQRDRLFKDKVIPELVKRQANDTAIAQARNKWNKQTDEVMSNAGLLPKAGQSSRSFAKDKRADKANQEAVKTGSNFPIIKEAIMSTGETIGNLFSQGVGGMIEGAAGFVRDIGENEKDSISAKIAKYGKNLKKDYENSASTFQKELQGGQHGKIPQLSAGAIQSVPAMALPFGAAKGVATVATKVPILASKAPYLGIVAGKAAEHTQNYGEVRRNATANLERDFPTWEKLQGNQLYQQNFQKLLDSGVNINQARQQAHADTLDALSEGAADKYGTAMTALGFIAPSGAVLGSGILRKAPTSKIGKTLVGGGVSSDLVRREMTQAPRVGMAKLIPDVSKTANIAAAKMVGKQALEEGLQGGIGEYGAQVASANIGGQAVDYGKVGQTVLEEGLIGGIMGSGMQSGLGGSPTSQAKEVAKQLRNQTNALRQEEAAARSELAQAMQFNDPKKIESAKANLSNIGAEANKVKAAYGQYGIETPYFVERFASQYQPQEEPEPEAQQDVDPAPEAAPQTEPVQPAQPAPAQPTQVNNGMANTTNLVMDSVTKGLISPEEAQAIQTDPILGEVFSLVLSGDQAAAHNIVMNAVSLGNIDMNQAQNLIESIPRYAQLGQPQKPSLSGIVNDHVKQQIQPSQDGGLFSNTVDLDPDTLEPIDQNQPSPFQDDFNELKQFMNPTRASDYVRENGLADSHELVKHDDGIIEVRPRQNNIPEDPNLNDFGYNPAQNMQPVAEDPNLTDFSDGAASVVNISDDAIPDVLTTPEDEQAAIPVPKHQKDFSKPKIFSNMIKAKQYVKENQLEDMHEIIKLEDSRVQVQLKLHPGQSDGAEPQKTILQEEKTPGPEQKEEPAPSNDASFADQIRDAHINNPKTKAKLINDEVAKGRSRPDVLKEVSDVVKAVNDSKPKEPESEAEKDLSASKETILLAEEPIEVEAKKAEPEEKPKAEETVLEDEKPQKDQKIDKNGIQENNAPDSMKSGDIGRESDNKPFANKSAATTAIKKKELSDTHEVVQLAPSQFVLREKAKPEDDSSKSGSEEVALAQQPQHPFQKNDIGRESDNNPFANKSAATTAIKKKELSDTHEVVQLAPSEFVLREKLESEQKQYESSISDMNNAKQSTPKTVDSVVRDHSLKDPLDDIQHRESGIIHSIPRELMDQVHKLGDILNDLSSLKTDEVKTNVIYDKELLTKLAKLNPDVRVHIVSDLVNSSDPIIQSISDQLQEGGFYSIDSGVSYIYPRSSEWKGTLPELINHELIHAATQEHIDTNKLTPEQLERLEEFKEMIWSNNRESVDDIDPDVLDRINYAIFTSYPHEMFTVFGAESSSREILSQIGILDRFDTIFNNVLKEAANDNGQIKQRSSSRVNEEGASEGVSGNAFRIPATIPTIRTATSSSENIERSSSNQPASLSSSEKNEVDQLVDKNKKNSISDSEMPLHSRTKNQKAQGSDPKQVRAELVGRFGEDAINQLESNGVLTIVPTHTEQGVEGFAENGKVTLVADAITPENIVPVFLHELGGHVGIQGVLKPSAYENLMSDFDRLVKASNPDALEAKRLAERETDQEIQKDEYLPYLITVTAKNQQKQSAAQRLVSRVLGAIKAWAVHKLGLNLKLNSSDILALAERMVKTVAKNPPPTPPKGKLKTDQTETEAFKKWFSDSKVIDESGKPKIVYHGTNQSFNIFNVSDVGIHAGTMDQANSRKGEKNSGEFRVMPLYMRINNPLRLKDSPSWKDPVFYLQKTGIAQYLSKPLVQKITGFYDELKGIDLKSVQGQEQALDMAMGINRRVTKELKAQGYDGIVYKNTHDGTSLENKMREDDAWIVFDPEQIKSATTNNGNFDSSNPDIRYSRSSNPANTSRSKQRELLDAAAQTAFGQMSLRNAERAKTLSNRTLNLFQTMLHKSLTDKSGDFKKTFDLVQGKINHVTFASTRSMDVAPNVLTQLEEGSDYWKEAKRVGRTLGNGLSGGKIEKAKIDKDLEKIGTLLFENTLLDNSERHTDKELRQLGFDDEQIGLYNEVREAIDTSLDTFANTTFSNIYKHLGGTNEEVLELEGLNLEIHAHYNEVLKRINALTNGKPEMADARQAAIEAIDKVFKKANDLKDEGYVPLMRFGKYFVRIYNPTTGEVAYRQHFESESERNMYYRKHANDDFPAGFEMEQGRINELQHKLFQGVSPETVALFAKESGLPIGDAEKAYIKFAVKNNHALKRLLRRQGIDGFDTDLKRVLAAFVMSNARYSANQTYNPAIDDSIVNIKDPAYQEDAIRLRDYSLDTQEELAPVKNFAFVYYMGFSAMFGLVNLTQPILQTLPYLMQYSKDHGTIFKAFGKAVTTWRKGADVMEQKYKAHYERARKNGHLDPQNTWMMQGLERGKSGLGASTWQLISHASGMFAQASETVNRRTTLFAALDVAESMGQAKLEKLGFEDAYDFAVRAIQETQGIYNKGNRPRVARGNIGSVLMMYKQFMIAYLEQMSRMQKSGLYGGEDDAFKKNMAKMFGFGISRSVLVMLGVLMSVSGATGLPFVRDILDGIETAGGLVGKPVNTEREVQIALHDALGQTLGSAVNTALMDGFVNLNPLIDVKGRMGMGDLIPATAYFSPTTSDYMKSAELANIAGPIGGLIEKVKESVALAQVGAYGQAGVQLLPKAVTSMGQGAIAATTGDYRNMKTGVKTNDATVLDGIIKAFDAQPASIAKEGRIRGLEMKDKAAKTAVNARWKERYEAALDSGDRANVRTIQQEAKEYNKENPRYPVTFNQKTTETNYKKSNQKWQDKRKDAKGLEWMDDYNPYLDQQ